MLQTEQIKRKKAESAKRALATIGYAPCFRACPPLTRLCEDFPNTTRGQWWIVHVQPTNEGDSTASLNTTHGSGWIVQVQPTDEGDSTASLNPTHGECVDGPSPACKKTVGGALCFVIALPCGATEAQTKTENPCTLLCRLDLNDPPT